MRRTILSALTLACAASQLGVPAAEASRGISRSEISAEMRLSVSRGFRHLIAKQAQNPLDDFDSMHPVAVNALVGLAFLAGGTTQEAGPEDHVEALRKGTRALLRRQSSLGYFDDSKSRMYGHGFATLFLAELYGTSAFGADEMRQSLKAAIAVIEGSQSEDGGWDYDPSPRFLKESRNFGGSDTSITVCQTMALRAARNLGIKVQESTIARAKAYILRAQNPDGGFRYRQGPYGGMLATSAFPRSAAGVCILYSLGEYNTPAIKKGFEYLYKEYTFPWSNRFPFYGHYYCAQAMFQAGGKYWGDYFPWIAGTLMESQQADGSWKASGLEIPTQATAMALVILQLPYRFLPIHER